MQSIVQIFKIDELRKGVSAKTGKPWEMQSAQCALMTQDGQVDQVGVLDIPAKMREGLTPGLYTASFAMNANFQTGRIEAVLTGLVSIPSGSLKPSPAAKAAA